MKTFATTICFVLLVVAPCAKNEKSKDEKAKPYLVEDQQNYSSERQIRIENENTEDQIEQLKLRVEVLEQYSGKKMGEHEYRIGNLERQLAPINERLELIEGRLLVLEAVKIHRLEEELESIKQSVENIERSTHKDVGEIFLESMREADRR